MNAQSINYNRARDFLWSETGGLIFSCVFTKKDGTERKMVCRRHVKKGVTGEGMRYDAKAHQLIPVFDMQIGAFRMVNLLTLKQFKFRGETYSL